MYTVSSSEKTEPLTTAKPSVRRDSAPNTSAMQSSHRGCRLGWFSAVRSVWRQNHSASPLLAVSDPPSERPGLAGTFLTPYQCGCQLQRVGCPQIITIHKLHRLVAHRIQRLNDGPGVSKALASLLRLGPGAVVELLHPNKSCQARSRSRPGSSTRQPPHSSYKVQSPEAWCPAGRTEERDALVSQKAEDPFTGFPVLPAILAP